MTQKQIELDFGNFKCSATLFDNKIADNFISGLPYKVDLTRWGEELYGSIKKDLGEENPVEHIPAGGIAYTRQGQYVCIFFGQTPAWAVEHIGEITGNDWEKLLDDVFTDSVIIRLNTDNV